MTKTVFINIGAKVDGAVAGLRKVKVGVDDLTKADLVKPQKAFDGLATKAAFAGAAVAFGMGKAIASFADFDSAMSAASAALPDAGAKMEELRDLAVTMGKDTQFSATEAANAITELGKAGVEAEQIYSGGLKGALDLAAAGQLDVARAAEIAGIATKQFNLEGADVPHVADLYAAAAGKATGSVDDIANAMKFAGVTASSMGISIEETTGVIGLFASKGIIGEQAGTSFRSMLLSLTAPSKLAKTAMDEYNISLFDASGNFIGMEGAADQLKNNLGRLDEATRTAALGQIFGNESIGAAIALYQAGGSGVADWTAKVNDSGFAAEQAAKLTDNLKGDVERLSGSLETVFIQAGSGANDMLRTLAQGAGGLVDVIGRVPGPILLASGALTSIALLAPKGIGAFRNYKTQLDTLGISFDKVSAKAPRTAKAVGGLAKAGVGLAVLATTMNVLAGNMEKLGSERLIAGFKASADGVQAINDALKAADDGNSFRAQITDLGDALQIAFNPDTRDQINNTIGSLFGMGDSTAIGTATARLAELDSTLASLTSGGDADQAAVLMAAITTEAQKQGVSVEELKKKFPQYAEAVARAGNESSTAAPKMGEASTGIDAIKEAAEDAKTKLDVLSTAIAGFGSPLAEQRAAQRDYADSVRGAKEAVQEQIDALVKQRLEALKIEDPTKKQTAAATAWAKALIAAGKGLDINTEAGSRNQAALDAIRDKALGAATSTFALTKNSKLAADEVRKGRADFIAAAIQMGLNATEANTLADNMKLIPSDIETTIGLSGVDTANSQLNTITGKVTDLDDMTATPGVKAVINRPSFMAVERALDHLDDTRQVTIVIKAVQTAASLALGAIAKYGTKATGGPIIGPGTGTSDTAGLFALSNNEHVWTAAEVAAAGGHAAVEGLRKAVLSGGIAARAGGGAVFTAPPSSFRSAPSRLASPGITARDLAQALAAAPPTSILMQSPTADPVALAAQIDWTKRRAR